MKIYYLTLSQVFPATHPRKGEKTWFKENLKAAISGWNHRLAKLHTIRGNYERWERVFAEIYAGNACLSVRMWSGKPYRSKQIEIVRLTKEDGIGVQMLVFSIFHTIIIDGKFRYDVKRDMLAMNDGLLYEDWENWFKDCNISKPLAIIHFTKFRY